MEKTYLGNPNLKAANQKTKFTKKQVEEFIRCQDNPIYLNSHTFSWYTTI